MAVVSPFRGLRHLRHVTQGGARFASLALGWFGAGPLALLQRLERLGGPAKWERQAVRTASKSTHITCENDRQRFAHQLPSREIQGQRPGPKPAQGNRGTSAALGLALESGEKPQRGGTTYG